MGLIFADARNLIEARGARSGGRAITLGRLATYFHQADIRHLRELAPAASRWFDAYSWGIPADGFFRDVLNFDTIDSLDFSDYQGAGIIHDLNVPIADSLVGKYDLAVDGGTLEHIFNFPAAVANLMRLVDVEGLVYSNGPCNNMTGHGFYQFSPELMFRVFSAENGFETQYVRLAEAPYTAIEITSGHKVYEVRDPDAVRTRVTLTSSCPIVMMTLARRTELSEPFTRPVLQSDYVARWREGDAKAGGIKEALRHYVPASVWSLARGVAGRRRGSLRNRRHFERVW